MPFCKRNPKITPVVDQIHRQLLALGVKGPGIQYVQWNANALKVNKGERGAIIGYDRGRDLYDVQGYDGMDTGPVRDGIYAENLAQVVKPLLSGRGGTGRRR